MRKEYSLDSPYQEQTTVAGKKTTHGFAGVSVAQGFSTPHLDMTTDWSVPARPLLLFIELILCIRNTTPCTIQKSVV